MYSLLLLANEGFPDGETARWNCPPDVAAASAAASAEEQKEQPDGNWLPYLGGDRLSDVTPRYATSPVLAAAFPKCPGRVPCRVMLRA